MRSKESLDSDVGDIHIKGWGNSDVQTHPTLPQTSLLSQDIDL